MRRGLRGVHGVFQGARDAISRAKQRTWVRYVSVDAARRLSYSTSAQTADFRALAATFAAIENVKGSRDASIVLLADHLRTLVDSPSTLSAALFLTASKLAPPHEGVELRFGTRSFAPVLQRLLPPEQSVLVPWDTLVPSLPDYGRVIPLLQQDYDLQIAAGEPLSIKDVHKELVAMAKEEGKGSLQRKQDRAVALLQRCTSADEMVAIVRLLAHQQLRIGMGEKSILTALAQAFLPGLGDNGARPPLATQWTEAVTRAFSQQPDYAALASLLHDVRHVDALDERITRVLRTAKPRVGVPVLTMSAYPIASVNEALKRLQKTTTAATCEYKYDGARVQVHLKREADGTIACGCVFSRNMEDQTDKYGSLLNVVASQLREDVQEIVLEGEVVAMDRVTGAFLPFQVLQTKTTTDFCLFAFDLLALDGENCVPKTLRERRTQLQDVLRPSDGLLAFVEYLDLEWSSNAEEEHGQADRVRSFLQASVAAGCEGLMVKTLAESSEYRAGARSFSWMKLKHDYLRDENEPSENTKSTADTNGTFLPDTLDLVPIAAFYGKGRRVGVFGSFLLASYDATTGKYETIGKVGSGFSDAQLTQLSEELTPWITGDQTVPEDYVVTTGKKKAMAAGQLPDVWFRPAKVWEIRATQLTLSPSYTAGSTYLDASKQHSTRSTGLALRFPRFVRVRPEKAPSQATESALVAQLFQQQQINTTDDDRAEEKDTE
ncbi:hypothetical protein Poli38472_013441 [Pythium oligandrum]|uniref:DNA ligase n=1 Tax=Pythium oligandrum TaxID=41045 RepID=A0A8K1C7H5_PYTOL|nr:hypothetical protein Poli38472_013441 [Pythium oligandrum]|eukprot:TMW57967.1 hypothetical protein Poli38472_013441 [Pythium oligandrum]